MGCKLHKMEEVALLIASGRLIASGLAAKIAELSFSYDVVTVSLGCTRFSCKLKIMLQELSYLSHFQDDIKILNFFHFF